MYKAYRNVLFITLIHFVSSILPNDEIESACSSLLSNAIDQTTIHPLSDPKKEGGLIHGLQGMCDYLEIRDLCSLERVCRVYQSTVRSYFETKDPMMKILPFPIIQPNRDPELPEIKKLMSIHKPKVAIIFNINRDGPTSEFNTRVLSHFYYTVPYGCHLISVGCLSISKNHQQVEENNALGLFLSEKVGVELRTKYITAFNWLGYADSPEPKKIILPFLEKLTPRAEEHSREKPYGLILFNCFEPLWASNLRTPRLPLMAQLKKRFIENNGIFALIGGQFVATYSNEVSATEKWLGSLGMMIAGPKVLCASLVIDKRMSREDQVTKMRNFKAMYKINPKRSIALSVEFEQRAGTISPSKAFMDVFPDVNLAILGLAGPRINCIDSMTETGAGRVTFEYDGSDFVCFMVIYYI